MAFFDKPFQHSDYKGIISWDQIGYSGLIYHACSIEETKSALADGHVSLKSDVCVDVTGGTKKFKGLWTTLNFYVKGYRFGPALFAWPSSVLAGKNFVHFQGKKSDSHRHAFVEMDAEPTPPGKALFDRAPDGSASLTADAIYNIVVRTPLSISGATLQAVAHTNHMSAAEASRAIKSLAVEHIASRLPMSDEFRALVAMFHDLRGTKFSLDFDLRPEPVNLEDLLGP